MHESYMKAWDFVTLGFGQIKFWGRAWGFDMLPNYMLIRGYVQNIGFCRRGCPEYYMALGKSSLMGGSRLLPIRVVHRVGWSVTHLGCSGGGSGLGPARYTLEV